jgi:FKBP-type peptidyl-prolyl cis-trans isomerase FkpA
MRKQLFLLMMMLCTIIVKAQTNTEYTFDKDGLGYKIIPTGTGDIIKVGNFMVLHFVTVLSGAGKQDSILNSTMEQGVPQIVPMDSSSFPPTYFTIFSQIKNGDSISTVTYVDSLIKKQGASLPAFLQKGMLIYTNIKVVNILKDQAEAEVARKKYNEIAAGIAKAKEAIQIGKDDAILKDYFSTNNIVVTKTPLGVYVKIDKEGIGPLLNKNQFVNIKYNGKTLDGKMFDSNIDPSKGHPEPLLVNLTGDMSLGNGVIPGMTDALLMMKKGTKAVMYIPSTLGYGARGAGADIPANACLIFEVEILNTKTIAQVKAKNKLEQDKLSNMKSVEMEKGAASNKPKVTPKPTPAMKKKIVQSKKVANNRNGGDKGVKM